MSVILFYYQLYVIFRCSQDKIINGVESCKNRLECFASSTSNFTQCAIRHARPIRLCERCVGYYMDVLKAHEDILKAHDEGGHACKMELVNLDRLQVIEGAFNYVHNLWQRGQCNSCFVANDNGTLTPQLSNITTKFQQLYSDTQNCFNTFYNVTSKKYDPAICANCTDKYCSLNKYYEALKADTGEGIVCMDIVDAMNSTRTKWSKVLGCHIPEPKAEILLIISVVLTSIAPVIFYVAAKRYSGKAESRLLKQRRLSLQFNGPSASGS
ncbi:Osteopetrosis-associated transmembrane protein 1 [Zootermopsis nevadensis]|uniref:Osteopetrosis-associated transmembrane protein 1 n=1 Tax=Zootermopsis nevadensis TaxID=136037 RepID=A0A067RIN4_ZOONE|nr:Osteopetrosis-associated transmembrane protein 1 [Zootermopsis nevadensis]